MPDICAGLRNLGIDATIAQRDRLETEGCENSLGLIEFAEGPIRFANVFTVTTGGGDRRETKYYTGYIVPDSKTSALIEEDLAGKVSRYRPSVTDDILFEEDGMPMAARVVRIELRKRLFQDPSWTGEDQGLGIIERINGDDLFIGKTLYSFGQLAITSDARRERWVLSTLTLKVPTQEIWNRYVAIAQQLLATDFPGGD